MTRLNQTRYISLSPGKEHSVEVSGTKVSTATGPTLWKLEGDPLYIFCIVIFLGTRSYAALRAADLDWIVGPGYSLGRVYPGEKP